MPDVAIAKAIVEILSVLSSGPLALIVLVLILLPPTALSWALYKLSTALVALRDEVRKDNREANGRYDNNVVLVHNYEKMAGELMTMVRVNVGTMEQLASLIKHDLQRGK
jgi:hypothetical protein